MRKSNAALHPIRAAAQLQQLSIVCRVETGGRTWVKLGISIAARSCSAWPIRCWPDQERSQHFFYIFCSFFCCFFFFVLLLFFIPSFFWLFNLAFFLAYNWVLFLFYYYFLLFSGFFSVFFLLCFSFIMLCCEPRRQSKCLSTLRDLAIVMVEQAWIGELLPLSLLERLVKLVASHPLSVCLSVWRKLKLTKICYILPAHKVRPPTAEAPSHSLLLNSLPLSPTLPVSLSLLLQLDFFYFFFGCFVCFVLLLLLLLKFATVHLYAEVRLQFFNIFYFFWFFFLVLFSFYFFRF